VQVVAREPVGLELVGSELRRDAARGEHRALAGAVDERDDDTVSLRRDRAGELDPEALELVCGEAARAVARALAEPPGLRAERRRPGGDVRALAARGERHRRRRVRAACDLALDPHDDVEPEVTERDDAHGLRSSHGA
jgi:hypothetical protein